MLDQETLNTKPRMMNTYKLNPTNEILLDKRSKSNTHIWAKTYLRKKRQKSQDNSKSFEEVLVVAKDKWRNEELFVFQLCFEWPNDAKNKRGVMQSIEICKH